MAPQLLDATKKLLDDLRAARDLAMAAWDAQESRHPDRLRQAINGLAQAEGILWHAMVDLQVAEDFRDCVYNCGFEGDTTAMDAHRLEAHGVTRDTGIIDGR